MSRSSELDPAGLIEAWYAALNAHAATVLPGLMDPDGTYEDPLTRGPIPASALPEKVERLFGAFPDLEMERRSLTGSGDRRVAVWVLRGHNHGPLWPGAQPSHVRVEVGGVDVFDLGPRGIRAVRSYFDEKALVTQTGLLGLVRSGGRPEQFGYAIRVADEATPPPALVAVTHIAAANEAHKQKLREQAHGIVAALREDPAFVSVTFGFTGLRGFMVTMWSDPSGLERVTRGRHGVNVRQLQESGLVSRIWTTVWAPAAHDHLRVRCARCNHLEVVDDGRRRCTACDAELPEPLAAW